MVLAQEIRMLRAIGCVVLGVIVIALLIVFGFLKAIF